MNNPKSQEIVARFYEALQYLINDGQIKSRNAFCTEYDIHQSRFWKAEQNHASQMFQLSWLTPLIVDYSISANWLMTGTGTMVFKSPPDGPKNLVPMTTKKEE